ncbi:AAA family ATPase, partial [Chloroflexota bacterium]
GDKNITDIKQYIKLGKLGQAFASAEQVVLLIDEVDKADIEFPNDLLNELDEMSFYIPETDETVTARHRPITVITSNAEKELPDAFLRRCIFHYIEFPTPELMDKIVRVHFPDIKETLLHTARHTFYNLRELEDFRKKPSTSELIDWIRVLLSGGISHERISKEIPFTGTLLKKEQDYDYFVNHFLNRTGGFLRH